jgi:hypothetical protein
MTNLASPADTTSVTPQAPQPLLAWTFRRDTQFLTCELLRTSDHQYAVIVTPQVDGAVIVEEVSNGVNAFHRHAALALQLRQQGWSVVAYAPIPSPRTPAPQVYPRVA